MSLQAPYNGLGLLKCWDTVCRFKTADIANEFKNCFDAAKNDQPVPEQTIKSATPLKSRSRPVSESHSGNRSRPPSESQGSGYVHVVVLSSAVCTTDTACIAVLQLYYNSSC